MAALLAKNCPIQRLPEFPFSLQINNSLHSPNFCDLTKCKQPVVEKIRQKHYNPGSFDHTRDLILQAIQWYSMSDSASSSYLSRFGGVARLYGTRALELFRHSHVAVIGIGGVGSWSAEALARSGVGRITLIDLDDVCVSNTNRQIHALNNTVGQSKTTVMAERIRAINPECRVEEIMKFVTEKSVTELITKDFDFVIDAIDSVRHKSALISHCRRHKIKLICVGGAGGQTDPTLIEYADLSRTYHDPLLAKVRKKLRQDYHFPANPQRRFGIEAVFSTEQQVYPTPEGGVCQAKPGPTESARLDCASGFGAATAVTASFGLIAASRVLKKLAAKADASNG